MAQSVHGYFEYILLLARRKEGPPFSYSLFFSSPFFSFFSRFFSPSKGKEEEGKKKVGRTD